MAMDANPRLRRPGLPTPEEIRERAEAIQRTWTEEVRAKRRVLPMEEWRPQTYRTSAGMAAMLQEEPID